MDVYTQQGNIIREHPNSDGTTIVELEFLFQDLFWSRLYGIGIFYLAFHHRLGIDYVVANARCTRAAVRTVDFDPRARDVLIATLLEVKAHSNAVLGIAQRHLLDKPPTGALAINRLDELRPYEVTQLDCLEFVEQLAERLPAPPAAI